jgi:hypothetical protein
MGKIQHLLERRGLRVSEDDVALAMETALTAARFEVPYPDPRATFSPSQLRLLKEGGFSVEQRELGVDDPIVQTAFEYALLRSTALTTRQAADRLGVNDSRVRQRLGEGALFGIKAGDEWRLPLFQFAPEGLVPGIDRVLAQLPRNLNPVVVHRWFRTPNPDLEGADGNAQSPLDWLQTGNDPDVVAELARLI